MSRRILIIITFAFLAAMLFLSFFAEEIHNAGLPKVTTARPKTYSFEEEYTDENGVVRTIYTEKSAVSKEMLESGVYVIYTAEKNGTKRSFVRLTPIETGVEKDGYYEIISGIGYGERIVTESTGSLHDGCEVIEIR